MTKTLDKDPIKSLFFKYYMAALTSLLSITLHQIVNAIILAQRVGKEAVTAVGLFGPVFTVFIALALALMIGSGILVGRHLGAKNFDKAQEIFNFSTTLAILFGVLVASGAVPLSSFISTFLAGSEDSGIRQNTFNYMVWGFLWIPVFLLRMLWGNLITNDGAPNISRNASLIAVILNVILDVLLVIVFSFGVAGASIATGISVFASCLYLFFHIKKGTGHLSFKNFKFTIYLKEWKELVNYGLPSFISEISFAVGLLVIGKSLVPFGAMAISAFGIINHLSFIFLRLFTSAMMSALPIMSFNAGAGLSQRVLATFRFSLFFTFVLGVVVSAIGFIWPDFLVNLFSGNESENFKEVAYNALGLYFILFVAAGPNYILGAYLQTIGKSGLSSLLNVLKGVVLISAFVLLLPSNFNLGVDGIWLSRSFTEITALVAVGIFTLFNRKLYYSHDVIMKRAR
jgi:Na+-driven multidrug efflux pump